MKADPKTVLKKLEASQVDPNSTAVREIMEEIVERVLRNLSPEHQGLCAGTKPASQ